MDVLGWDAPRVGELMRVYVLESGDHADRMIVGVFASLEAAQRARPGEWIFDGDMHWCEGDSIRPYEVRP
jgi:hypothetical protein